MSRKYFDLNKFGTDKAIEEAKKIVVREYEHGDTTQRKWLKAHLDSYRNPEYRISLYVLEGSPAKGYVVVNHDSMGVGSVMAFSFDNQLLAKFLPSYQGVASQICPVTS